MHNNQKEKFLFYYIYINFIQKNNEKEITEEL